MSFEDYSAIEEFRIQYHGESHLRLLKRAEGTRQYELLAELTHGFFIGRDRATEESQLKDVLTIDFRYSPSVDPDLILSHLFAVDLVRPDDTFLRYSVGSDTPPSFSRVIYSQTLNANFDDRNEIIGIFVPDPDVPIGEFVSLTSLFISGETPSGLVNGVNATFGTAFDFQPSSVEVFLNGLAQKKVQDFNTSGNDTIIFNTSPGIGETILVNYIKG